MKFQVRDMSKLRPLHTANEAGDGIRVAFGETAAQEAR